MDDGMDEFNDQTSVADDQRRLPDADELNQEVCNADASNLWRTQLMHCSFEKAME